MKTIFALAILLSLALATSGCATCGYLLDRGRDAADIFTATLGIGCGIKARAGPIQPALFQNADLCGLRTGQIFWNGNDLILNDELYTPFPLKKWQLTSGTETFRIDTSPIPEERAKYVVAYSPFPGIAIGTPATFYTQIELAGGLGLTLRLGFNAGELLDFILGWSTLDILNDDIGISQLE